MMSKEQKKSYVEEMKKVFSSNEAIMIAHYKGLNVKDLMTFEKIFIDKKSVEQITKRLS